MSKDKNDKANKKDLSNPVKKILVVEDSRTQNDFIAQALGQYGYECFQAFDGVQALSAFKEHEPNGIILDLNIPKVHGFEVLQRLKRNYPYAVVIVLTGHGSAQTALQALRLGADDYLTKPIHISSLIESLHINIRRSELMEEVDVVPKCPTEIEQKIYFEAPAALVFVNESGKICSANRAAARLLGLTLDELRGRDASLLVSESIRLRWLDTVKEEALAHGMYKGEVKLAGATHTFPASVVAVAKPDQRNLIMELRDLTRQKDMERRFYESKKLASLGRVVEGVAHEVRNPLISLGGFARKLRKGFGDETNEARYVEVILSEVKRLEQMVNDIENFVQFSSHRSACISPFDLREILNESIASVTNRLDVKELSIVKDFHKGVLRIFADHSLMKELFEGLIENAVESMPSGGVLTVRCCLEGGWVQVRVEDTGVGISPDDIDEVFDPFFTSKTSGAGLGLAKAYLIVEEHAGTIDFESGLGRGTTCTVNLPVDRRRVPRTEN